MAARTRSAHPGGGLAVAVGDGVGEGVGLAVGEAQLEETAATTNRRMATSRPGCPTDDFSMAWASTSMDIRCPHQRAARSNLSSTGPSRAPIYRASTSA